MVPSGLNATEAAESELTLTEWREQTRRGLMQHLAHLANARRDAFIEEHAPPPIAETTRATLQAISDHRRDPAG